MARRFERTLADEYPVALLLAPSRHGAELLRLALRTQYEVIVVPDLESLLAAARSRPSDIVFLDLPAAPAVAAVSRLRLEKLTAFLPIVLLWEGAADHLAERVRQDRLVAVARRQGLLKLGEASGRKRSPSRAGSARA